VQAVCRLYNRRPVLGCTSYQRYTDLRLGVFRARTPAQFASFGGDPDKFSKFPRGPGDMGVLRG